MSSNIVNRKNEPLVLKTFTLYRSSAGSGKTRTLAKEYLKWALKNKAHYFRHILAVTFTNKATQEMKDRVLDYLGAFAGLNKRPWPDAEKLAGELKSELGLDDPTFRQNSNELLAFILHQYDQFSISTIDAFFQKVIRSFTRESGLIGDYRLEAELDTVFAEVIDSLIDELDENSDLIDWVVQFAQESLAKDQTWDIRKKLVSFANEIYRDEFKLVEPEIAAVTGQHQFFKRLREDLLKVTRGYFKEVEKPASEIISLLHSNGWTFDDLKYKGGGLEGFLRSCVENRLEPPGKRAQEEFVTPRNWPGPKMLKRAPLEELAEKDLVPRLNKILAVVEKDLVRVQSADLVLRNMYVFGLLSDISRKLKDYKAENNIMMLADAPTFLQGIIGDTDTPFVYEKVGSFYRHYLIDEFQDTSAFQWKNFLPLLTNNLDQGFSSMVVGDAKQAIYRWRGGDLSLLEEKVETDIGKERVEIRELDKNFRSAKNIVSFNNSLFASLSQQVALDTGVTLPGSAYRDVVQENTRDSAGFVKIGFVTKDDESTAELKALKQIPHQLELLQDKGFAPGDVAILVRRNKEGQDIAAALLEYKNSPEAKRGYCYDVVSNESLRVDGAASVNLLLSAMRYLLNPEDGIARGQLSFEFSRLFAPEKDKSEVFAVANHVFFESNLPDAFTGSKLSLRKLPLFELTETLIQIFNLGAAKGELAYLQAFQDLVLDYYQRERNDLASFLEWWEANKEKETTSIKVSGEVDAAKILTIHKAKGLQFKVVLIPFCSWGADHDGFNSPNVWVKSPKPPFADAGYLPVKYGSSMKTSFFREAYLEEHARVYLDNLNLLYVAFTRAEVGMIITALHPKSGGFKNTMAGWLYNVLQTGEFVKSWDAGAQQWTSGEMSPVAKADKSDGQDVFELKGYSTSRWREKLVIRQAGRAFFEGPLSDQRQKINFGIHLHAVFSRIHFADDMAKALDALVSDGLMPESARSEVQQQMNEWMEHPVVGRWFSKDWAVRTEVPILLPGGASNRIDRLMVKGDKAVVVDFKTGEKTKADQKQVLEYMDILRQMKFTDVEGYLLYTRDKEVIALEGGKQKIVKKKKDDSQLGLGFS